MRIYLAAPYGLRDDLRLYANELTQLGYECTATWLTATHELSPGALGTSPDQDDDYAKEHVAQDLEDVLRSDLLILFSWSASEVIAFLRDRTLGPNSGGRHVETGAALAMSIPVVVIGEAENIFHRGGCTVVPDWAGALEEIAALHDSRFA